MNGGRGIAAYSGNGGTLPSIEVARAAAARLRRSGQSRAVFREVAISLRLAVSPSKATAVPVQAVEKALLRVIRPSLTKGERSTLRYVLTQASAGARP